MRKFFATFAIVCMTTFAAFAQTTTGRLSGTVSGPDGVLPNATVIVKDNATGKTQTLTTNSSGDFLITQLEFGVYTVTITATGFKTYVANELKVDVGRENTLSATLEIGNITESVTITQAPITPCSFGVRS